MRSNNVPRKQRIQNHINTLQYKLDIEYSPIPYGGSNPYHYCAGCGRSIIETTYKGHYKGCKVQGIKREIEYYEKLLWEEINQDTK